MHHTRCMDQEIADVMSTPFQNCYNLTDGEVTTIALAGGITAAVCAVASFSALVILTLVNCCHQRVCDTVVKRLVVGYLASNVPFQLVLALGFIHNSPEQENFCKADGFFNNYFMDVLLLFALAISLVLFLTMCVATTSWKCRYKDTTFTCCCCKINKLETVLFISVFCLPLLFDWIPFTTDSFGPNAAFCWIRVRENNCSIHNAGLLEEDLLVWGPFVSVALLAIGLFIISLCLLGYAIKNAKARKLNKMGITDTIFFLTLILTLYLLEAATFVNHSNTPFATWIYSAIFTPSIFSLLIGLALLVVIHFPLSSMITCLYHNSHGHTHTESDQATIRASSQIQQPSHTTWNQPHSTITDSQTALLASDKQLQEYGSMA